MNIKNKIKITVNGKQMQIIPKFTLKSLITKLKMPLNKIAIELNKKTRIKILTAIEVDKEGETGEILENNLTIACKEKAIQVLSVQKEGKKILKTKEFLSGYKIIKGEKLN